ncbi:hypothetical protein OROHE_023892 [Orobanche hederae]
MARGKKAMARPRQSAGSFSSALPLQPLPSHSDLALLLLAGSQPSSANFLHAAQPTASEAPAEAVASTGEIVSETSGIKRCFVSEPF